jgi:hypothetical protein
MTFLIIYLLVKRVDLKVDSDFQKALQSAQRLLEMSDREIGDALSVSRPSVNRWMNGANLPYNAMRKVVFDWIEKSLTSKMRTIAEIERSQRLSSSSTPVAPLSYVARWGNTNKPSRRLVEDGTANIQRKCSC